MSMKHYLLTLEIASRLHLVIVPGDSRAEVPDAHGRPAVIYGRGGRDICRVYPDIIRREEECDDDTLPDLLVQRRDELGVAPARVDAA